MIYRQIERLCDENNISIRQLEKACGFGNSTIQKWQDHSPSVEKLNKVAKFFNVSIEIFLKE